MKNTILIITAVLIQFSCVKNDGCIKNKGILKITSKTYPASKLNKGIIKTGDSPVYFTIELFDEIGKIIKFKSYRVDRPSDSTVIHYIYKNEKLITELVREHYEGEQVYESKRKVIDRDYNK